MAWKQWKSEAMAEVRREKGFPSHRAIEHPALMEIDERATSLCVGEGRQRGWKPAGASSHDFLPPTYSLIHCAF